MRGVWDHNAACEVLNAHAVRQAGIPLDGLLDALEACVRPALPQSIDRDALVEVVSRYRQDGWDLAEELAGAILALLRPVDGVVLTNEECAYVARWLPTKNSQRARDLAERLESAS